MTGEHDVTFLFTDIVGSSRLWNRARAAMSAAVERHDALLRAIVATHDGTVFKTGGDAVYAVFTQPEDALRAAVEAQCALLHEPWAGFDAGDTVRVRMAIHTGAAEARDGDYFGPPLNRLSRTLNAGHGGQILCTYDTVIACGERWPVEIERRDLGERTLRDVPGSGHIFQLIAKGLPEHFPPLETLDPRTHNLPRWSSPLVGREAEQARIRALVRSDEARLVTVLGTGGVGKTRLAVEAVSPLLDEFQHGIRFVDLSALRDDAQVIPTIVHSTGAADQLLEPRDALLEWLRPRDLLLVLDNCEQVVAGVASICSDILNDAPEVMIIATSRVPIRIRGERQLSLDPFLLPDDERVDSDHPAVRLFAERATEVQADFALDPASSVVVTDICRMVDGLPLAIELAAAWVRILTPEALRRRLQESRAMLRDGARDLPDRQRALTSTIAWSYDLLDPDDQRAFRRLAVFRGGIAVDAAAAVMWDGVERDPLWALSRLDALVQANLLQVTPDPTGEPRFTMLQTIREFAEEVLRGSGEWAAAAAAHSEFFAGLAIEADDQARTLEVARWFDRLEREFENLRVAIEHFATAAPSERGLEMAVSLWEFLDQREHVEEARAWLTMVFQSSDSVNTSLRARAYLQLGNSWINHIGVAEDFYRRALTSANDSANEPLIRSAEGSLGMVKLLRGDTESAIEIVQSIVERERISGDQERLVEALLHLAQCYYVAAHYTESLNLISEAIDFGLDPATLAWFELTRGRVLRELGEVELAIAAFQHARSGFAALESRFNVAQCHLELGKTLLDVDRLAAHEYIAVANEYLVKNPIPMFVADALNKNGDLLAHEGDMEHAALMLAASRSWRDSAGLKLRAAEQVEIDGIAAGIRNAVGEERYSRFVHRGSSLSLRAAIDLAHSRIARIETSAVL